LKYKNLKKQKHLKIAKVTKKPVIYFLVIMAIFQANFMEIN